SAQLLRQDRSSLHAECGARLPAFPAIQVRIAQAKNGSLQSQRDRSRPIAPPLPSIAVGPRSPARAPGTGESRRPRRRRRRDTAVDQRTAHLMGIHVVMTARVERAQFFHARAVLHAARVDSIGERLGGARNLDLVAAGSPCPYPATSRSGSCVAHFAGAVYLR